MSNCSLVSTYSRALGLKIDKPFLYSTPYSLPFEKYFLLHNSSGADAKNYSKYQEVVDILISYFKSNDITLVQIGDGKDIPIEGCYNLLGRTNIHQLNFIIANSLGILGNDSMPLHIAGSHHKALCGLFGPTSIANHSPHFKDPNKTILIESHRNGKNPSFSFNENPKTIDFIQPEEVVAAVLKLLGIQPKEEISSLYFGPKYGQRAVETVLDNILTADFLPDVPLNIRYDYYENPQNLVNQLSIRKCLIITNKVIDINILKALKQNVLGIAYEIDDQHNPKFANEVRSAGIQMKLFTKWNDEKLNRVKLDYFDISLIEQERVFHKEDIEKFAEVGNKTLFKSRKILLSKGKSYLSKTHWLLDVGMKSMSDMEMEIIDTPKFFEEIEYFYIYHKKSLN